jgi:hypothetical protein
VGEHAGTALKEIQSLPVENKEFVLWQTCREVLQFPMRDVAGRARGRVDFMAKSRRRCLQSERPRPGSFAEENAAPITNVVKKPLKSPPLLGAITAQAPDVDHDVNANKHVQNAVWN